MFALGPLLMPMAPPSSLGCLGPLPERLRKAMACMYTCNRQGALICRVQTHDKVYKMLRSLSLAVRKRGVMACTHEKAWRYTLGQPAREGRDQPVHSVSQPKTPNLASRMVARLPHTGRAQSVPLKAWWGPKESLATSSGEAKYVRLPCAAAGYPVITEVPS